MPGLWKTPFIIIMALLLAGLVDAPAQIASIDSIPPKIEIVSPDPEAGARPVVDSSQGFTVTALAYEAVPVCAPWHNQLSGVDSVIGRVYDLARQDYRLTDVPARYNSDSGLWEFAIGPEFLPKNSAVVIGLQARDQQGNVSDWSYLKVYTDTDVVGEVPPGPSRVFLEDGRLMVQRRLPGGQLDIARSIIIQGVTWMPATVAPDCGPDFSAGAHADSVPYGFFFDGSWRLPGPQGHELMAHWTNQQFSSKYLIDIPLMKKLGVNTVRIFDNLGTDAAAAKSVLDELYVNDIMVIVTAAYSLEELQAGRHRDVLALYRDHPAVLMWSLGNEWNLLVDDLYGEDGWLAELQAAADEIRAADPNHLVTTAVADLINVAASREYCDLELGDPDCGMDVWGLNVYRNDRTETVFQDWADLTAKPVYLSECGTDSFRSESFSAVSCQVGPGGCAVNVSGVEDQSIQSDLDAAIWAQIQTHHPDSIAQDSLRNVLGGIIHSFNDSPLKSGNYHVAMGGLIDYDGPDNRNLTIDDDTGYDEYNPEGFVMPGSHPDGVSNEEYYGLVDSARTPKQAFEAMRRLWNPEPEFAVLSPGEGERVPVKQDLEVKIQAPHPAGGYQVEVSLNVTLYQRPGYGSTGYTEVYTRPSLVIPVEYDPQTDRWRALIPASYTTESWAYVYFTRYYWDRFFEARLYKDGELQETIRRDLIPDYDNEPPVIEPVYPTGNDRVAAGQDLEVRFRADDARSHLARVRVLSYGGYPYHYPQFSEDATWDSTAGMYTAVIPGSRIKHYDTNPFGAGDWNTMLKIVVTDDSPYELGNTAQYFEELNVFNRTPIDLGVTSSREAGKVMIEMRKDQEAFYSKESYHGRGFNFALIDPQSRDVVAVRQYDTFYWPPEDMQEVKDQCAVLLADVAAVCQTNAQRTPEERLIVMAGVGDTATPYCYNAGDNPECKLQEGTGMAAMQDCARALELLGSQYARSIDFHEPWAAISIPDGNSPQLIDEVKGSNGQAVTAAGRL